MHMIFPSDEETGPKSQVQYAVFFSADSLGKSEKCTLAFL